MLRLKRAYEPATGSDGRRILIDRLWPRGVSKRRAAIDERMKDIAPSTQLRRWFGRRFGALLETFQWLAAVDGVLALVLAALALGIPLLRRFSARVPL